MLNLEKNAALEQNPMGILCNRRHIFKGRPSKVMENMAACWSQYLWRLSALGNLNNRPIKLQEDFYSHMLWLKIHSFGHASKPDSSTDIVSWGSKLSLRFSKTGLSQRGQSSIFNKIFRDILARSSKCLLRNSFTTLPKILPYAKLRVPCLFALKLPSART